MTTKLLKPTDVAEVLAVTDREVRNMCASGELRAMKLGRNVWRIHPDDLDAFLREKRGLSAQVTPIKRGENDNSTAIPIASAKKAGG